MPVRKRGVADDNFSKRRRRATSLESYNSPRARGICPANATVPCVRSSTATILEEHADDSIGSPQSIDVEDRGSVKREASSSTLDRAIETCNDVVDQLLLPPNSMHSGRLAQQQCAFTAEQLILGTSGDDTSVQGPRDTELLDMGNAPLQSLGNQLLGLIHGKKRRLDTG